MELIVGKESYDFNNMKDFEEVNHMEYDDELEEIEENEREREKLIKEEMKLSESSYEDAALVVSKEHPELFEDAFK